MLNIYKREFKSLFSTLYGWCFLIFNLMIIGIFTCNINFYRGFPNIEYTIEFACLGFIFSLPFLAIHSYSRKSDSFYDNLPVKSISIVLGKYLAITSVFAITVLYIAVLPLLFLPFGEVNLLGAYSSIVAYLFYGCAAISIAVFISAISKHYLLTAAVGLLAMIILHFSSALAMIITDGNITSFVGLTIVVVCLTFAIYFITKQENVAIAFAFIFEIAVLLLWIFNRSFSVSLLKQILMLLSLNNSLSQFIVGLFDITSIIHFLSLSIVFLFFTFLSLENRKTN